LYVWLVIRASRELHLNYLLEKVLGVKLFERVKQRIVITSAGEIYLRKAQDVIHTLEQSTLQMREMNSAKFAIKLSTVPTFGAQWLLPRLPKLQKEHPEIPITFVPYSGDEVAYPADLYIKYGEGVWPNLNAQYLVGRDLVVLVGKRIASQISEAAQLNQFELIHHASLPHAWRDWNESIGKLKEFSPYSGQRFDQYSLIIEAVKAHLGVALLPRCLVQREIKNGDVVELFGNKISSWKGYYVCTEIRQQHSEQLGKVVSWLMKEAQGE
jgi:LysR family transcriptional regulator, glycine cleavage system transcriptional activator